MWFFWVNVLLGAFIILQYAYSPNLDSDQWILKFEFAVILLIFLVISLTLRFLLSSKIRRTWLMAIVFLAGMLFANLITMIGMFALLQGQQSAILLGLITTLLYCPHWIPVAHKSKALK